EIKQIAILAVYSGQAKGELWPPQQHQHLPIQQKQFTKNLRETLVRSAWPSSEWRLLLVSSTPSSASDTTCRRSEARRFSPIFYWVSRCWWRSVLNSSTVFMTPPTPSPP